MLLSVKLPSEPLNVSAYLSDDGYIHSYWNAPSQNTFTVEKYTVYWSTAELPEKYDDVQPDHLSYTIKGVHSDSVYTIYVKAGNHYGYSKESNQATVPVDGEYCLMVDIVVVLWLIVSVVRTII